MSGAKENPENSGEQLQTILVTLRGWQQCKECSFNSEKSTIFEEFSHRKKSNEIKAETIDPVSANR